MFAIALKRRGNTIDGESCRPKQWDINSLIGSSDRKCWHANVLADTLRMAAGLPHRPISASSAPAETLTRADYCPAIEIGIARAATRERTSTSIVTEAADHSPIARSSENESNARRLQRC
jgi:hypothetical protein